jgi:hypothetical protein
VLKGKEEPAIFGYISFYIFFLGDFLLVRAPLWLSRKRDNAARRKLSSPKLQSHDALRCAAMQYTTDKRAQTTKRQVHTKRIPQKFAEKRNRAHTRRIVALINAIIR